MITKFAIAAFLFPFCIAAALAESHGPAPSCSTKTADGSKAIDPANLKGKVAYVDFWASWCGPCAQSFPFMNELHRELNGKGLEIVAVNLDEEKDAVAEFLRSHAAQFTVALDPDGRCPAVYDVKAMPTSFLIDRKGNIREVYLGFKSSKKAAIKEQIQALLDEG
jgi:thiol-disulfide isomerase/thioredoxin